MPMPADDSPSFAHCLFESTELNEVVRILCAVLKSYILKLTPNSPGRV